VLKSISGWGKSAEEKKILFGFRNCGGDERGGGEKKSVFRDVGKEGSIKTRRGKGILGQEEKKLAVSFAQSKGNLRKVGGKRRRLSEQCGAFREGK